MAADIRFDGGRVIAECSYLVNEGSDFILEHRPRKRHGGMRRALVHDTTDGLTINWAHDYPGGVTINDARLKLHVATQDDDTPALPRNAEVGTIVFLTNETRLPPSGKPLDSGTTVRHASMWVCVPPPGPGLIVADRPAFWRRIMLADEGVSGTVV